MNPSEVPEIRVESVGDEVTYHLPTRPLGPLRLVGLLPIVFSAIWFGALGKILRPQFQRLISHPQPHDYFISVFLLGFVLAGCVPVGLGLIILLGRCRIRWRDGRLTVSERVGPFGWPRRMPRGPLRKMVVMGGGVAGPGIRPLPGTFGSLAVLMASFESGLPRTIATGYPRPWLEAIAQELSARAGIAQSTSPPPVEIYQSPADELSSDTMEKPAGSPVVMQQNSQGVVLDVPPAGLWKGSMGLFFFAVLWCLMNCAITAGILRTAKFELKAIPIFGVFWLVGLIMLGVAIHLGRRRFSFTAGPGQLTVVRSGPFGAKQFEFNRRNIAEVCVGSSNVEANHRPLMELQVKLVNGKKSGFLVGRDPEELRWIATVLRHSLGLAAKAPTAPAGLAGWLAGRTVTRQTAGPAGNILGLVIFAVILSVFFWNFFNHSRSSSHRPSQTPPPAAIGQLNNSHLINLPLSSDPRLVFNTLGPSGAYRADTAYAAGQSAHAEWFVPTLSGTLSEIKLALSPNAANRQPGEATVFITDDHHGLPGDKLESFTAGAADDNGLLTLESVQKPALQAGVKYWLCARSDGGWRWCFNNQNVVHNTARQAGPNSWVSAGDACYAGAFSIRVSTNHPSAGSEPENSGNH